MGCGEFLVKTILFITNLFFALAGLALLALGVVVQLRASNVVTLPDWNLDLAPITSMVVGGLVFIIAFFGCCGALRESNCMLVVYSIFMIILMIAKVALGTLIFVNLQAILDAIPKWLNDTFNQTNIDTFHAIESAFHCCGTSGPQSYLPSIITLPPSCCAEATCNIANAYPGCNSVIENFFNNFGLAVGCIAIVVAAIELVAAVFALCLANHARNKSRRVRY